MPSRPASINFFSNPTGSLTVFIRSFRYLAWMCTTILSQNMWKKNFYFLLLILMDLLFQKLVKIGMLKVFGHFLKKFLCVKRFCYIHLKLDLQAHWSYFCRCIKERHQRPKFGPFWASKFRFSNILLKSLVWIHISLALYAHWSYFQRCAKFGHQRPNFWAILGLKVRKISGVWSLSQNVFTGFTTVLLHTFRCVENMGLSGPIFGSFWAPK